MKFVHYTISRATAVVRILWPLDKPGRGAPSYYYTEREKNCQRISDGKEKQLVNKISLIRIKIFLKQLFNIPFASSLWGPLVCREGAPGPLRAWGPL